MKPTSKTNTLLEELAVVSKHLRIKNPDLIDWMWMTEEEQRANRELQNED